MRKLGIIGLGNVGALLANLLVARQIVDELVLIDTNSDLAVGLQNDLLDGMSAQFSQRLKYRITRRSRMQMPLSWQLVMRNC